MKILILAGDLKNYFLYKKMLKLNYDVSLAGFDHIRTRGRKKSPSINIYDLIITPIPFTIDELTLYSPYADEVFHIDDFMKKVKANSVIAGGPFNISDKRLYDVTSNKNFQELNILPVCEELIKIIIDKTDITLIGSSITIYGYGKIAKRLYKQLEYLGAYVHIKSDEEDIDIPCSRLDSTDFINNSDVIIHTLSGYTLDNIILDNINKDSILIDVASSDGGLDYNYAKKINIDVIKARGLSGKSAPKTVSEYLFNTLKKDNII